MNGLVCRDYFVFLSSLFRSNGMRFGAIGGISRGRLGINFPCQCLYCRACHDIRLVKEIYISCVVCNLLYKSRFTQCSLKMSIMTIKFSKFPKRKKKSISSSISKEV